MGKRLDVVNLQLKKITVRITSKKFSNFINEAVLFGIYFLIWKNHFFPFQPLFILIFKTY